MKALLIITHKVTDFEKWSQGFESGAAMREQAGISIQGVYRAADDPSMVTIISEAPNAEVAKAIINNPELQADMQKSGVVSIPEVKILHSYN